MATLLGSTSTYARCLRTHARSGPWSAKTSGPDSTSTSPPPDRLQSRRRVSVALERGQVLVNGKEVGVADAGARLVSGDVIRLWMDRPGSATRRQRPTDIGDLRILYEDDALLVVSKPPGLLTVPLERRSGADSVYDRLRERSRARGKLKPIVVHRIDRDTSGPGGLWKGQPNGFAIERAIQTTTAGASVLGRCLRVSAACRGSVAQPAYVGSQGSHSEGGGSNRPQWTRCDQRSTGSSSGSRIRR